MLWVRISVRARCTISCDKVCRWLATGPPPRYSWNIVESGVKHHQTNNVLLWMLMKHQQITSWDSTNKVLTKWQSFTKGPGENHIMLYTSPWSRFELTTSVLIGTDCISSCKSNYHTIIITPGTLWNITSKSIWITYFIFLLGSAMTMISLASLYCTCYLYRWFSRPCTCSNTTKDNRLSSTKACKMSSRNDMPDNTMAKRKSTKGQTTIYKTYT
jgi:hypothetical protein